MRYIKKDYSHLVGMANPKTRLDYRLDNIKYFFQDLFRGPEFIPLSLLCILFGLWLFDIFAGSYEKFNGVVIDKVYSPSRSSTGYAAGSNGKGYVTTTFSSEKYIIIVKTDRGPIVKATTDVDIFYSKKPNDRVEVGAYRGIFTNINYFTNILN